MTETGKIDREFFENVIATRLGADRPDVSKGPKHGVDFGVVDVGDQAVAMATDPISILPALGFERAGRFAIQFVLADVAVSGLVPSHLAVSFALPPEMTDEEFEAVWTAIHRECADLGVAVVTGHTARYEGCSFPWVGHGTALAVGDPAEIIHPDGAEPGDEIVVTNGPAVESVGLLSTLFPDQIPVDESTLSTAQSRLDDVETVRDAIAVAATGGVNAMHDATEGGLLGAFHEVASGSGVGLRIETSEIPLLPGVSDVADALGMDPWRATSSGTLVLAVDPDRSQRVLETLTSRETPAAVVGRVELGDGVVVDGKETAPPDGDSSWPVYERLVRSESG